MFEWKDEGWSIEIRPEVLLVDTFKTVWNKYDDKDIALVEFAYIYFMADYSSDFADIANLEEREQAAIEALTDTDKLKLDDSTKEAISLYKDMNKTTATMLLDDMKYSISKLRQYFREVDLLEETEKGALKYDISKLTSAIKSAPTILKSLTELEEEVKKGTQAVSNVRGNMQKGIYD